MIAVKMLAHAVLTFLCVGLVSATVVCPDGGLCPDKNTCCLTTRGYGCCNDPFAVCCSDQLHCCPAGYRCGDAAQSCVKDGLPWFRLQWTMNSPAKEPETGPLKLSLPDSETNAIQERPTDLSVVWCNDNHTTHCPDGTTCCLSPYFGWGCCNHPLAQCCSDGIHCCPHGYYCDSTSTQCLRGGGQRRSATYNFSAAVYQSERSSTGMRGLTPARRSKKGG
ncbi:progranulin-like isoform X1 [Alosa sapidissima]|uniref:progranulin-like isoform X1 n=1 Tax=Alosa sapidissima TaxID=34773 RepID=UPI001C08D92C|nr:progranulin-like isoform X1 [Alosa sapidissima]XP_041931839.1 progranulin-like isoform X1 [Alosa sapidissima]